jgi:hypothetical protein
MATRIALVVRSITWFADHDVTRAASIAEIDAGLRLAARGHADTVRQPPDAH